MIFRGFSYVWKKVFRVGGGALDVCSVVVMRLLAWRVVHLGIVHELI